MDETGRAGRFGGPARLPLALAGILLVVAIGLVALVAAGITMEGDAPGPVAGSMVGTDGRAALPAEQGQDEAPQVGADSEETASESTSGRDDNGSNAASAGQETASGDAAGEVTPDPPAAGQDRIPGDNAAAGGESHGAQPAPDPAPAPEDATPAEDDRDGAAETAAAPPADPPLAEPPSAEPHDTVQDRSGQGPKADDPGAGEASQGETAPVASEQQPTPEANQMAALPQPPPMPTAEPRGLPPAPDPSLVEPSPEGPLPRVGPDGRKPWQAYARPFDAREDRPRVAVIVSGLGLSSAATEAAIQGLPSEVTLAFQPFADNLQQWIRLARAAGHEVLLNLPMEPVDYPESDPGPKALFVTLTPEENIDRLRWAMSRVSGYVGVLNHMGSRFTTSREAMVPVLDELKNRGLLFVDARSSARSVATILASERRVPRAINDRFLDAREVSRANVDARLEEVVRIAEEAGVSVAIGQAFPVTIERIREWTDSLDRSRVVLAPISAVVDRQGDR